MDGSDLCCIAFQPEAHQSAWDMLNRIVGWTLDVVPSEGEQFCGVIRDVKSDDDGEDYAVVQLWDDDADEAIGETRRVPIYGTRFEVI